MNAQAHRRGDISSGRKRLDHAFFNMGRGRIIVILPLNNSCLGTSLKSHLKNKFNKIVSVYKSYGGRMLFGAFKR